MNENPLDKYTDALQEYGIRNTERKLDVTSYKSKAEEATSSPIVIVPSILIVTFFVGLCVLGNLWVINEIADYF